MCCINAPVHVIIFYKRNSTSTVELSVVLNGEN